MTYCRRPSRHGNAHFQHCSWRPLSQVLHQPIKPITFMKSLQAGLSESPWNQVMGRDLRESRRLSGRTELCPTGSITAGARYGRISHNPCQTWAFCLLFKLLLSLGFSYFIHFFIEIIESLVFGGKCSKTRVIWTSAARGQNMPMWRRSPIHFL